MAVPIDYDAILQDEVFINWIYDRRSWKIATIEQNESMIKATETFRASIKKHLDY